MMNIKIKETGKQETLELIDRKTGVYWEGDLIGNYDGLGDGDHQFKYDEDSDTYICSQDTFDWWQKVLADQQELEDRLEELKEEHGNETVSKVLESVGSYDLEDQAAAINAVLDEAFPRN